jgi:predicted aspartyl protease
MGIVYVEAEVASESGVALPVRLLVDSGAIYSVLPTEVWTALELVATREMEFILADGTPIIRRVSRCMFTYAGTCAPSPVVLGEPGDGAILGAVTLECLALVLNPFDRTLRPMRARLAAHV